MFLFFSERRMGVMAHTATPIGQLGAGLKLVLQLRLAVGNTSEILKSIWLSGLSLSKILKYILSNFIKQIIQL